MDGKPDELPGPKIARTYNFSDFNILLVHENKFMSRVLGQMLRGFGAKNVTIAPNTDMAITKISESSFDFILVDLLLRPLDGFNFIQSIRASPNRIISLLPIIVITGHAEKPQVEAARDSGANEFLKVPLATTTLFDRIVSLIDNVRPFVRTETFFGPDRRRGKRDVYEGPFRRASDIRKDDRN